MDFPCSFKIPCSTKPAPHLFLLVAGTGQHRLFPASWYALPHPLQTACRGALDGRRWRSAANRSQLPLRSVLGAPHWGAAPEAAAETSPSAPATKPAETLGFRRFSFCTCCIAIWCILVRISGFPPVRTGCTPPQHPKRTRFLPFWPFPGAFFSFSLFFGCKIFVLVFVHFVA